MNPKLKEYMERFEALTLRERLLVSAASLATLIMIGYSGFIEPQATRLKNVEAQYIRQKNELNEIQEKINLTETSTSNQQADNATALNRINEQIEDANDELAKISHALVSPDNVTTLLKEILKRNNRVELVSLQNFPSTSLAQSKTDEKKANETPASSAAATHKSVVDKTVDEKATINKSLTDPLFKHSVEITVTGSYNDLLAYLNDLEKMPQRLLWNSIALKVESYPRSKMTIIVYTLSFDKTWLTL